MDFRELNITIDNLKSKKYLTVSDVLQLYQSIAFILDREVGKNLAELEFCSEGVDSLNSTVDTLNSFVGDISSMLIKNESKIKASGGVKFIVDRREYCIKNIADARNLLSDKKRELEAIKNEISDLKSVIDDIAEKTIERDGLKKEIDKRSEENEDLKLEVEGLRTCKQTVLDSIQELEKEKKDINEDISDLEKNKNELEKEVSPLRTQKSTLDKEIKSLTDESAQLKQDIPGLILDKDAAELNKKNAEKEKMMYEGLVDILEKDIENLRTQIVQEMANEKILTERFEKKDKELTKAKASSVAAKLKFDETEEKKKEVDDECTDIQNKIDDIKRLIKEKNQEKDRLIAEQAERSQEEKQLIQEIENLGKQAAALDIKALNKLRDEGRKKYDETLEATKKELESEKKFLDDMYSKIDQSVKQLLIDIEEKRVEIAKKKTKETEVKTEYEKKRKEFNNIEANCNKYKRMLEEFKAPEQIEQISNLTASMQHIRKVLEMIFGDSQLLDEISDIKIIQKKAEYQQSINNIKSSLENLNNIYRQILNITLTKNELI